MSTPTQLHPRPTDATLTVMKAAHVLGVHSNTVRAWSDAGRLRYYRINPRGDRRYRLSDLQHFLAGAAHGPGSDPAARDAVGHHRAGRQRHGRPDPALRAIVPVDDAAGIAGPAPVRPAIVVQQLDGGATRAGLEVITALARIAASVIGQTLDPDALLGSATRAIREGTGLRQVSAWRLEGERLIPAGVSGPPAARLAPLPRATGLLGAALSAGSTVADDRDRPATSISGLAGQELATPIPGSAGPWGVLLVVTGTDGPPSAALEDLVGAAAGGIATIIGAAGSAAIVARKLHRAEALGRVASDIGGRLDLDEVLAGLVDHAMVLFNGNRAAAFLYQPDGTQRAAASRGLSANYLAALAPSRRLLANDALAARRPAFAIGFRDDPRGADIRAAIVQEGFDTGCVAPLLDADGVAIGSLNVYHDRVHAWNDDEIETLDALASQASVAIRSARTHAQLATWAAQLQSLQQLGARLSRLSTVGDIGAAIATELGQLIENHNIRVYRLDGTDLVPVAMKGRVGEYVDETAEQLRVKVGSGITGWVAEHRVAQILHDAAADPRANTVPGTEADLDESMLLAPMLYEDSVLGVLVLALRHRPRRHRLAFAAIVVLVAGILLPVLDEPRRAHRVDLAEHVLGQRLDVGLLEDHWNRNHHREVLERTAIVVLHRQHRLGAGAHEHDLRRVVEHLLV